jgi:hypothetical protein
MRRSQRIPTARLWLPPDIFAQGVRIVEILLRETNGNQGDFKSPVFKIGDFY